MSSEKFYLLSGPDVVTKLSASTEGLSDGEVKKRLEQHGRNNIPQPKSKTLLRIFLSQFLNPLIYVLIAAAVISLFTGDSGDAIFITAIITINAVLGTYQESRAENSAKALRDMVKVMTRVRRGNKIHEIDSEELVPGDVVLLESGNKIPADLRLLEARDLAIEEALLTGESVAVVKNIEPLDANAEHSLGDQLNMAFAATTVQKGRGIGIVTATAQHTEIGRIADSLRTTEPEKPPLERRMESFSRRISVIVVFVCIALGIIGYFEGMPAREVFFLMVAVGVSAIPEGLPVALTVALSIGTRRMARRNVIVRKLPAVEGLGSCTLIASDKTGTLTMDQQSVQKLYMPDGIFYNVTGIGYTGEGTITDDKNKPAEATGALEKFLVASILANEGILRKTDIGWEHSGDSVDVAIRALAYKIGKEPGTFKSKGEVLEMIPYESEQKYSAVFYKQDGQTFYAMKGAVEVVGKMLKEDQQVKIKDVSEQMAADGFRVLAMAGASVQNTSRDQLPPLELLGLIGMIDPLREEAKEAVIKCQQAGIRVVMVTGDHPATALAIGKSLGIVSKREEVITGTELSAFDNVDPKQMAEKIKDKMVFARVAPLQKQRIVEAFKALGHFVAVTGDGANDAPALKSAHIGVAMGGGTDLAKEASSIIITDNNFASITAGVEEGRITFSNLRKVIYLLISTGAAELLIVALAIIFNLPLPFIAVQLLWLNLVTNGIQDIALSFEKGHGSVMQSPPRKPDESIFDKLMNSQMLVSGLVMAGVLFGAWLFLLDHEAYGERHARSVVMMLMVFLQNFHALNCRSETESLFRIPLRNNYTLIIGLIVAQSVHIAAAYIPGLNETLQLEPITLREWLILLPAALSILLAMEIFKMVWRKISSKNAVKIS
ncbi:HAD-IC family P-type ATPase [Chryseolinea sp. T2]|uniref:cation-translocating P-type ATPase n=1 Tax=Chryseolinea sp. T2 TaxID=3129255 RepID=UPI003076D95A